MNTRIKFSIGLGLMGCSLCFLLPHIHDASVLITHLLAAALVVLGLAIAMVDELRRVRGR